ncbi:MAG: AAA family ATPase [Eubacterium sp.]|nr:AAA family ATPase [Eubacterium sp.]
MKLTKVEIRNYRLLVEADLTIDEHTTLIVGRNNTAKTSLLLLLSSVLNHDSLKYNDYPLSRRKKLFELLLGLLTKKITYEQFCKDIPKPSIKFYVDYSDEGEDNYISGLSPFIIDVDEAVSQAIIFAEYSVNISESDIGVLFKEILLPEDGNMEKWDISLINTMKDILASNFGKIFSLSISAINPLHTESRQIKSAQELKALFPLCAIRAERNLDESGESNKSSLHSIISSFFSMDENDLDEESKNNVIKLRQTVNEANINIQKNTDSILSQLVNKCVGFGYPNADELQLGVSTKLALPEQIQNNTELTYRNGENESLPSEYNGLGYKNLIKIQFQLAQYASQIKQRDIACIPLLFIEEPESHMHPQMQQVFIAYLEDFLKEISNIHIQVIVTSHSSHITNTVDFSKIRYSQRNNNGVIYKDLNDFAKNNGDNVEFIRKYMTVSRCDLFFADKAIIIEGASERLLLPDMIGKCDELNLFGQQQKRLPYQYISLIEVGGAYAYKFIPFVNFLGIPSLIITDIDSVDENGNKTIVSRANDSSNATIKYFIRNRKKLVASAKITIDEIKALTSDEKTLDKVHLEFQTTENGLCGRSLEESIINVNRELFKILEPINENKIEFKGKSKTEFALNLILDIEEYNIPNYIKDGLIWLNEQAVII